LPALQHSLKLLERSIRTTIRVLYSIAKNTPREKHPLIRIEKETSSPADQDLLEKELASKKT
jgi:hypothetical protein